MPAVSQEEEQRTSDEALRPSAVVIEDETDIVNLDADPWTVHAPLEDHRKNKENYVRTTKYTVLTFLPLNIWYQFRRFYNLYFLASALSISSGVSSLSPISQITPLVVVFCFAAVKEAIEDYGRYTADKTANNIEHVVIRNGKKESILSMNIKAGDIIYLEKGKTIPVDAMILSSSYEDGTCFIETANLDGETNLKRRTALMELNHLNHPDQVSKLKGKIECEKPNENLNVFTGRLVISNASAVMEDAEKTVNDTVTLPLNMSNLLLRGCVLRNTDHVYALVVYTGINTKIMKNLKGANQKSSTLQRHLNYFTLVAFLYNAFILITSVVFKLNWYFSIVDKEDQMRQEGKPDYAVEWYLGQASTSRGTEIIWTFFSFFTLYTYVIPISLFVTMEMCRLLQGQFMMWDKKMRLYHYHPDGTKTAVKMKARNTNLNEELARVQYIFSDKTGTLTQNNMRAYNWFIDDKIYDEMAQPGCLAKAVQNSVKEHQDKLVLFCRALGLCHSVIPAVDEKTNELVYESQSPDETALLIGMRTNKMKLVSRNKASITVENGLQGPKQTEVYKQLASLEFTSDRKRMSVVVECPNGEIHLYCKGADNIILDRLSKEHPLHNTDFIKHVKRALHDFSVIGLRTLCVAYRTFTKAEWAKLRAELDVAESSLTQREERIYDVCERIEKDLVFVGCTAIEDRLQDEVPETIDYLLNMGIKVWLLTGDKRETAINIGMSTKLISPDMNLLVVDGETSAQVISTIEMNLRKLDDQKKYVLQGEDEPMNALVISGQALTFALLDANKSLFLKLCVQCHSVICCRVTPLQKALVVRLVKTELKVITLSIGDGANDVSMIQEAHIGVGIQGREGGQAVRASDFAFAEFRFLKRLISVHGRYSYHRLCQLIMFSFYKNITLITVQWWFGFVNGWSGQTAYEEIFLTVFNVIFTSLPPFALALFDKDVNEEEIDAHPQLFLEVRNGMYWNIKTMLGWGLSTYWHALCLFGAVYFLNYTGVLGMEGESTGYWVQCYLFGTPLLFIVMGKISLITRHWVWLNALAVAFSLLLNVGVMFLVEVFGFLEVGTPEISHVLPSYYLTVLLVPFMCLIPDLMVVSWKRMFNPSDADLMMEESFVKRERRVSHSEDESIPMRPLNGRASEGE